MTSPVDIIRKHQADDDRAEQHAPAYQDRDRPITRRFGALRYFAELHAASAVAVALRAIKLPAVPIVRREPS